MSKEITFDQLKSYEEAFTTCRGNRIAMNAVTNSGVYAASKNPEAFRTDLHQFSISLEQGEITNQKRSGRCWMFAALNTLRFQVIKKLNLETFELSQAYTLFYDKLEKANYFLESILETLDQPTDSRLIAWLLMAPVNDGGQWDMICALVEKYGVVPKACMPETYSSSNTGEMNSVVTEKLREDACVLRTAYQQGKSLEELRTMKDDAGNYLWRNSDDTILGYKVIISNFMPSAEAGKCPIVFGDFTYYWVALRKPVSIRPLFERFSMYGQIAYLGIQFLDGRLIRREAMKAIQISGESLSE